MKSTYSQTGGGFASDKPITRISGPANSPGATWPFVKIALYPDHLTYTITGTSYRLAMDEIDSVNRIISIPVLGDGIKIHHHGQAPKIIIFWSLFRQKRLLHEFEKQGVIIGQTELNGPFQPSRVQRLRIVLILAIALLAYLFLIRK